MDAGFGSSFRAYSIVNFNVNSLIEFNNHPISPPDFPTLAMNPAITLKIVAPSSFFAARSFFSLQLRRPPREASHR